jgi:uncharacterized protein YlxP (DUF503 family)
MVPGNKARIGRQPSRDSEDDHFRKSDGQPYAGRWGNDHRLSDALKNKFNVSVAECGAQNSRTLFDIAVAALAADSAQADSIRESIQRFAEDAAEAELYDVLAERR